MNSFGQGFATPDLVAVWANRIGKEPSLAQVPRPPCSGHKRRAVVVCVFSAVGRICEDQVVVADRRALDRLCVTEVGRIHLGPDVERVPGNCFTSTKPENRSENSALTRFS